MAYRIVVKPNQFSVSDARDDSEDIRYRGIVPKPRTHPRLIVRQLRSVAVTASGVNTLSDQPTIIELDNFILETAHEPVEEKYQIVQTFGPDFIFLYGSRPRIFTYAGKLFNTMDKPWKSDWQRAWDRQTPKATTFPSTNSPGILDPYTGAQSTVDDQKAILSGTNVVINGGIARLEYDGSFSNLEQSPPNGYRSVLDSTSETQKGFGVLVREGYIIYFETQSSSANQNYVNFKFSMFVTNSMDY